MKVNTIFFNYTLDQILAISGIFISIALFIFLSLTTRRIVFELTAILSFFSCVIWLFITGKASIQCDVFSSKRIKVILLILFNVFFIGSIFSLYWRSNQYERPLIYFFFISILVSIIAIEILFSDVNSHYIFIHICLIGISLFWSQNLIFPELLGVDTWWHQTVTLYIIEHGLLIGGNPYSKIPLFHILVASTSLLLGSSYKMSSLYSISSLEIICNVLFIYLICKRIINSDKVGYLSSLLLVIANYHIFMSYSPIPNSLASIFILPLIFISIKIKKNFPLQYAIISLMLMITIILTHTITALFVCIVLFIYYFSYYSDIFTKNKHPISLNYSILFTVFMFFWWSFVSGTISSLSRLIASGFAINSFIDRQDNLFSFSISSIPLSEQFFNNSGHFIFFAMSLIGFFYMVSKRYGSVDTFAFSIAGITPLILAFMSLISQHSIIEQRWWYFAQILLSIPFSISVFLLLNLLQTKSFKLIFMGLFTLCICFLMIMSPVANNDNHVFSLNSAVTYSLKTSEIQALKTNSNYWHGNIKSDSYYSLIVQINSYKTEPYDIEIFKTNNTNSLKGNLVLVREEITNKPSWIFRAPYNVKYNLSSTLNDLHFFKTYDCGTVYGFI